MWSIGILTYTLVLQKFPISGVDDKEVQQGILNFYESGKEKLLRDPDFVKFKETSPSTYDFILGLLQPEETRWDATTAMQSAFITNVGELLIKDICNTDIKKAMATAALNSFRNYKSKNSGKKMMVDEAKLEDVLYEATLAIIGSTLMDPEQKEITLMIFKIMDESGDGQLGTDEIIAGFQKVLGEDLDTEEAQRIIDNVDLDGNNYIDYQDFMISSIDFTDRKTFI